MSDDWREFEFEPNGSWPGHAKGGPLDGAAIGVASTPGLSMRGLEVHICVGDSPGKSDWHVYRYRPRFDHENQRVVYEWPYLGTFDPEATREEPPARE